MENVSAIILAGGRGRRMGVLCEYKPKPALPYGEFNHVIDCALSNCLNSEINKISVATGYQRSYLSSYLQRWQQNNAKSTEFSILSPPEGYYRGTADAVYQNIASITSGKNVETLVLAADHIYQMDYRKMLDFHRRSGADVTIAVKPVPITQAHLYGIVITDSDHRILHFVEKPQNPRSNLVSMGIYIFNTDLLDEYLTDDAHNAASKHDFGFSIMPEILSKGRAYAYPFPGYWQDIGTPEAYHQANMDLIKNSLTNQTNQSWPLYSSEGINTGSSHNRSARRMNSLIGKDCVIKGWVENSIISSGVWVSESAVVKNSVVMSNTSIGRHSVVSSAIMDENIVVGEHCLIGSDEVSQLFDQGVTVLGPNTRVASNTVICHNKKSGSIDYSQDFRLSESIERDLAAAMV